MCLQNASVCSALTCIGCVSLFNYAHMLDLLNKSVSHGLYVEFLPVVLFPC